MKRVKKLWRIIQEHPGKSSLIVSSLATIFLGLVIMIGVGKPFTLTLLIGSMILAIMPGLIILFSTMIIFNQKKEDELTRKIIRSENEDLIYTALLKGKNTLF